MTILAWIFFLFFSGGSLFDMITDSINCYNYDWVVTTSEYFISHNMNFESYDLWRTSVLQTYEFNKQVGFKGSFFEIIDNQTYENMKFMVRTYRQEEGMFSFWSVYV